MGLVNQQKNKYQIFVERQSAKANLARYYCIHEYNAKKSRVN